MHQVLIRHVTTYSYSDPVSLCHNVVHLRPRHCFGQTSDQTRIEVRPEPAIIDEQIDYFGNPTTHFSVQELHSLLEITATHRFQRSVSPLATDSTEPWESVRDRLRTDRGNPWLDAFQYTFNSSYSAANPTYSDYAAASFIPDRPILDATRDLTRRIHLDFVYDPRATTVATPVREVFDNRRGVCQDFAHFQLACLRSLGLAARYVSGYLSTQPPPGRPRLVGADASHAWVSVYCGDAGWVDFDPTNNLIPGDRHFTLAWGRDFDDVSPVKGVVLGGGQHRVSVFVDVAPIDDDKKMLTNP